MEANIERLEIRTNYIVTVGDEQEEDLIQALSWIGLICLFVPPMFVFGMAALIELVK